MIEVGDRVRAIVGSWKGEIGIVESISHSEVSTLYSVSVGNFLCWFFDGDLEKVDE